MTRSLCLTDGIKNDINRNPDDLERQLGWELVQQFTILPCDQVRFEQAAEALKSFFPASATPQEVSDLWHVARTISANIQFFVTRDQSLLNLSGLIYERFGVTILRPTDLIIRIDELQLESEYVPQRLARTLSEIRRVQSGQESILTAKFQAGGLGENKSAFQQPLRNLLADPERYSCHVAIDVNQGLLGLFAYGRRDQNVLEIRLIRVTRGAVGNTLARHILFRPISLAAKEQRPLLVVTDPCPDKSVKSALLEDGFQPADQNAFKIVLPVAMSASGLSEKRKSLQFPLAAAEQYREELVAEIGAPQFAPGVDRAVHIERLLWPAKITDAYIPSFIVPIRPEWAKELFDEVLARQTLFAAKNELGLNREAIYYRSKNPSGGLKSPARILWYVSFDDRYRDSMHLRACSRLEDVLVDHPKSLFGRFRRLGIYEWRNVYKLADHNIENELMALRFSDTELLKEPIEWDDLQQILRTYGCKTQIQSPVDFSRELFSALYKRGMPDRS